MKNRMKKQKDISDRKAIFIFVSISVIIFLFVFLNEMGVLFDENGNAKEQLKPETTVSEANKEKVIF